MTLVLLALIAFLTIQVQIVIMWSLCSILKIEIESVNLGAGKPILRLSLFSTKVSVGWIPFSANIQYQMYDDITDKHPLSIYPNWKVFLVTSIPILILPILSFLFIGQAFIAEFTSGFSQIFGGLFSPFDTAHEILAHYDHIIQSKGSFIYGLGILFAKLSTFNCLPIPVIGIGQALVLTLWPDWHQKPKIHIIGSLSAMLALAIMIAWLLALITYVVS